MFFAIISVSRPCQLLEPHAKAVDFHRAASDESTFISFKSPFMSPFMRQSMGLGGGLGVSAAPLSSKFQKLVLQSFQHQRQLSFLPFFSSFPSLLQVISSPALQSSRQAPHQLACHMPHFLTTFWLGIANSPPAKESPL